VSGLVADATGSADAAAAVVIFPADYQAWVRHGMPAAAARSVAAAQTGTYAFPHLPPGEYLIAAMGLDALDVWQQPSVVAALAAQATRVSLVSGSTTRVDLRRRR
jgi:hypothetical protein